MANFVILKITFLKAGCFMNQQCIACPLEFNIIVVFFCLIEPLPGGRKVGIPSLSILLSGAYSAVMVWEQNEYSLLKQQLPGIKLAGHFEPLAASYHPIPLSQ